MLAFLWFSLSLAFIFPVTNSELTVRVNAQDNLFIGNFEIHKDHKLSTRSKSSLKNVSVLTVNGCMMECTADRRCVSVNVHTTRNDQGKFDCTLLDVDKYRNDTNLMLQKGIDHYTLPTKCTKKPCQNNGMCVPVYVSYSQYYCRCPQDTKGEHCQDKISFKDCASRHKFGLKQSGVFNMTVSYTSSVNYQAYCDMISNGGGWTVIQTRIDGSVDFFRGWADYKKGFGNKLAEYWLGLDVIHALTSQEENILEVQITWQGVEKTFTYSTFKVASEVEKYSLSIGGYQGWDTTESMLSHNNHKFSTKDQDNDITASESCAIKCQGGWWYYGSPCLTSNLNGVHGSSAMGGGIIWSTWKGYYTSMDSVQMKIRPKTFI